MDKVVACLSPNGTRETVGTEPATRLLIASIKGVIRLERTETGAVYASENKGASWSKIAESLASISKDGHYRMFQQRAAQASGGGAHA